MVDFQFALMKRPFPVVNVIAEASPEGPGASEATSFVSKGAFVKDQFSQQRSRCVQGGTIN